MDVHTPLQATLNLVAFMANLLDLNQFKTILVLHDQNHRDHVNFLMENLQPRYDVAWILVNEFENPNYWNHAIIQDTTMLILTAVQQENVVPFLMQLYNSDKVDIRTKTLIVSSDISKLALKNLPRKSATEQINAVFVDWTLAEVKIYAWNPKKGEKSIELNETEFLSASIGDLTNRKYSGVFFDELQSLNGEQTIACTTYDVQNVYNVISKDSVASLDGMVIRIADMVGEAIRSPVLFLVLPTISSASVRDYLQETYRTYEQLHAIKFYIIDNENLFAYMKVALEAESLIQAGGLSHSNTIAVSNHKIYQHDFGYSVIIVENNTTTTATTFQRIFTTPVIYFWILLIAVFVVFRCGLQWLLETNAINTAAKRRRCVFMCQDTVQISCGLAINTKLLDSHSYGHKMLAQGATLIPLVTGMFLSGLLYGEYLIRSEIPAIDSIEQLEKSNLTICNAWIAEWGNDLRFKNEIIYEGAEGRLKMILSGNTSYAYVIPECWTSLLDMDHLRPNGRPLFHVIKERYGSEYQNLVTVQWYMQKRMSAIVMRLQEHGFVTHFDRVSKWITKQKATEIQSNVMDPNSSVAKAGGLQELLIACGIYLVGILFAIIVFIVELFFKKRYH